MADFMGFLFLASFITAVSAAVVWIIYRRVMFIVRLVREARQYFKNKKETNGIPR